MECQKPYIMIIHRSPVVLRPKNFSKTFSGFFYCYYNIFFLSSIKILIKTWRNYYYEHEFKLSVELTLRNVYTKSIYVRVVYPLAVMRRDITRKISAIFYVASYYHILHSTKRTFDGDRMFPWISHSWAPLSPEVRKYWYTIKPLSAIDY